MKRILDSSKTVTQHLVRSNSKSRRPYTRGVIANDTTPSKLLNSNTSRHLSVVTLDRRDDGLAGDLDVSKHNMPEKLNWYFNLDEDHKRKITDPTYVRQAVQDTFMQRAQGGYHYKRSGPVRNNSSGKSIQPGNQQKSEVTVRSAKAKSMKPLPLSLDKDIPMPQVPRRKRIIDNAKPMQLRPKPQPEQRRVKSGKHLKEAGQKQLEEAKKKLYNPAPAVLDYLIEKHVPKTSGLQVRGRKQKPAEGATQFPQVPSLMQRVFGWKGKEDSKKNDSGISITPRSIEVRNRKSDVLEQKQTKQGDNSEPNKNRNQKQKKTGKLRISLRGRSTAKKETVEIEKKQKKPAEEVEEKTARQVQAEEDREAIWNKMKTSPAPVARTAPEVASIKRQVRDLELTPQIYPKGSLSLRKSYLPITACRPRSDVGRTTESSAAAVHSAKQEDIQLPLTESPTITHQLFDSLKNIFSKMRRNSA